MAAWPRHSTRIGPALRHSGYLLSQQPNRQRLIILMTDGKPMDQGYESATRYAQHDVRMACEEIARQDIHTFAISTEENAIADMEIMFPHRRFAILPDLRRLPEILPRLYIQMTVR
jgi:nitric oxide reductase NorD protein